MNNRNTAIILAALRIAQEDISRLNAMPHIDELGGERVTEKEIEVLCEEINLGPHNPQSIVQVKYFGNEDPEITTLGDTTSLRVELIDGEEEHWLFLEYNGVRVYNTSCHESRDDLSDYWFSTERGHDRDDGDAFDVRDLPEIPRKERDRYLKLVTPTKGKMPPPVILLQQATMAYAIDQGHIKREE